MKITKKELKNEIGKGNAKIYTHNDEDMISLWIGNIPIVCTSWHVDYPGSISLIDDVREDWLAGSLGGDYLSDCAARRLIVDALKAIDIDAFDDFDPDDLSPQTEVKNKFVDFLQKKLAKI